MHYPLLQYLCLARIDPIKKNDEQQITKDMEGDA
nr:MAG TPA: hypothetical protein [Caudoviricetes sp.]